MLRNQTHHKQPPRLSDARDVGSIPGFERSPREGKGNVVQYSCQENYTDRDAWQAIQSMGLQRVGHPHTLSTRTRTHAKM